MEENVISINTGITKKCDCKKHIREIDYTWNPSACSCKNGRHLASIIDDSVITCDEITDTEVKSSNKET